MSSFAKLNRSIWSAHYSKLIQSYKLDLFVRQSKEFVLRNCYTIVSVHGINFEQFTDTHQFVKPNDLRGKRLMDHCAKSLHEQFRPHILLSYGFSDQFSFVLRKSSDFGGRNLTEILSVLVSSFTSNYVFNWRKYFDDEQLKCPPAFKGSTMLVPNDESLISYLLTKQHECYHLNLNATLYSALVGRYRRYDSDEDGNCRLAEHQNGDESAGASGDENAKRPLSNEEAMHRIQNEIDSISKINEVLFKEFAINYNNEPELFRKGSLIQFDAKTNQLNTYNMKLSSKFLSSLLPEDAVRVHSKTSSERVEKGVNSSEVGKLAENQMNDLADQSAELSASNDPSLKKQKTAC